MTQPTIDQLVKQFELQSHPEGGFYRETYRASETIPRAALPDRFKGDRSHSTAIYFLIPKGKFSSLHRIQADEGWHFYLGGPLTVVQISPKGKVEKIVLGQDVLNGQKVQHVVPAGYWFGAYPNPGSEYSLVGCTVAPGFDFADFELGTRADLLKQFPQAKNVIEQLTQP